jgi:hypothetical protein
MKKLFHIKAEEIKRKVVDDPASFDGSSLLLTLDEAISTKDVSKLYVLWEYIKDRRSRLRVDFTADERLSVDAFICTERLNGLFILSRGALEAYLPLDCRNKDMEKVIKLTSAPDFWEKLPSEVKPELELIISGIKAVSLSAAPMQA